MVERFDTIEGEADRLFGEECNLCDDFLLT